MKNYTPHEVTICNEDETIRIPAEGDAVRLREIDRGGDAVMIGGKEVAVVERYYCTPDKMPPGIVSLPVLMALAAQGQFPADLYTVDTGPRSAIRDDRGQIIGVKRLMRLAPPSRAFSPRDRLLEVADYGMFDGSQPAHFLLYVGANGWLYPGRFPGWHGGVEPGPLPSEMAAEVKRTIYRLAHNRELIVKSGAAEGRHRGLGNDEERMYPRQEVLARRAAQILADRLERHVAVCLCDLSHREGQVTENNTALMHWQVSV